MNSKIFWYFMMFGAIALWLAVILVALFLPRVSNIAWILFGVLIAIHISEYPLVSAKICKEKGLPPGISFLKTFLFGFTWWLPLNKGIIKK